MIEDTTDKKLDELDNKLVDDQHTHLSPEVQKEYDQSPEFIAECERANKDSYPYE